jgi:tetratricopeptide (TPR) repeat protein
VAEFNLNKALQAISSRVTDEQRVEQDELNRQGRQRLAMNSFENRIARAKAQEKGILEQVDLLKQLPESFTKTNRMTTALDRLGELYAEQGRYEEAIEVSPSPERREHYQQVLDAIKGWVIVFPRAWHQCSNCRLK